MHAEIFLAVMVLAVALLVAADFFRRSNEGPHEHAERPAYEAAGRGAFTPPGASRGHGPHGSADPVTAFAGRTRPPAPPGLAWPGPARAGPVLVPAPDRPARPRAAGERCPR